MSQISQMSSAFLEFFSSLLFMLYIKETPWVGTACCVPVNNKQRRSKYRAVYYSCPETKPCLVSLFETMLPELLWKLSETIKHFIIVIRFRRSVVPDSYKPCLNKYYARLENNNSPLAANRSNAIACRCLNFDIKNIGNLRYRDISDLIEFCLQLCPAAPTTVISSHMLPK